MDTIVSNHDTQKTNPKKSQMVNTTPYYSLLFRIRHPSIAPEEISRHLGMEPKFSWKAGEQCVAPNGALLKGTRQESYWYEKGDFSGKNFSHEINELLDFLTPAREFLHRIVTEKGRTEIYLTLPGSTNIGDTLNFETLKKMTDLKINLSIEVFPHKT